MWRIARQTKQAAARLGVLLVIAAAEAQAQENQPAGRPASADKPQAERRIIVSLVHRKLALVEDGHVVRVYAVAIGAPGTSSPNGEFRIATRIPYPAWYAPGKVVPPGKPNPLGTRWIGLSLKGYGIHGTNQPNSIGRRASHGCIRMRNRDVEELFERVRIGDIVELAVQPRPQLAKVFGTTAPPASKPAAPAVPVVVAVATGQF